MKSIKQKFMINQRNTILGYLNKQRNITNIVFIKIDSNFEDISTLNIIFYHLSWSTTQVDLLYHRAIIVILQS
jgi:hypothetical protein